MIQLKKAHISIIIGLSIMTACTQQQTFIPKPPTYLELQFPERTYSIYQDNCGYSFSKPSYFTIKEANNSPCNRDIDFGMLNGVLFLSRMDMDTSLSAYINYALGKIDEHKIKATAIYDSTFIRKEDKVYGTFFELQGNVASPFQFYLTDSTSRFVSGVVYFNTRPNYDSIKPVLNFVKKDLYEFMNTLKWDN
ncbi:MAG: gliding motility lipoprotein GldD [Brumimicrobium sp.]|nr:gliding motility lipoprotein GldD [Brumimicrobium sp.]MCO5269763.1 gliding motility lipoprotein GldD [Brumimicrobium sp.]